MTTTQGGPGTSPAGDPDPCGPRWHRRWGWWPVIPLAILGGLLAFGVSASVFGATWWGPGPVPFLWPLFPFGVFLAVIVAFILARQILWHRHWDGSWGAGSEAPDEILRRRFARGEISTEQFHEMRRTLDRAERTGDPVLDG
jgi:uncharacterized membrane protein